MVNGKNSFNSLTMIEKTLDDIKFAERGSLMQSSTIFGLKAITEEGVQTV